MLALQIYMENFLGNVNSHLSLGTNKVKSYNTCFDLFHQLDENVQCMEEEHSVSNVYAI